MKGEVVEKSLLERIANKDEEAFRTLYERTHRRLYLYLMRLSGDSDLAEDVLVDTFTEVWKSAGKFQGKSAVLSWIIGIARNKMLKELTRKKVHASVDDYPHIVCDKQGAHFKNLLNKDLVSKAMKKLSPEHREILDLVFLHGLDYQEISRILGIPVGTVKTRVFHAKKKMKEIISEIGTVDHE